MEWNEWNKSSIEYRTLQRSWFFRIYVFRSKSEWSFPSFFFLSSYFWGSFSIPFHEFSPVPHTSLKRRSEPSSLLSSCCIFDCVSLNSRQHDWLFREKTKLNEKCFVKWQRNQISRYKTNYKHRIVWGSHMLRLNFFCSHSHQYESRRQVDLFESRRFKWPAVFPTVNQGELCCIEASGLMT